VNAAEILTLLAIGLAAGMLAGLLGIGGGVLMVPAMVLIAGFDQHVAQGTSLLVIIPAAALGSFTHHRRGRMALREAAVLGVGGVIGAIVGSTTALALDEDVLRRLFAVLILVVAGRLLLAVRRASEPPVPEAD
jgi:uncharacterized membrane protein YfcA